MRWSSLCCLLLLFLAAPFHAHADCASAVDSADKTLERAVSSFSKKDYKAAQSLSRQAAQKYTTASHSCEGEQKTKAKNAAGNSKKLAAKAESRKLRQDYNKAVQISNEHHAEGSKLAQQDKWTEAARKYDKAASVLKKYTRSKDPDIQASAKASVEGSKASAEVARTNAKR